MKNFLYKTNLLYWIGKILIVGIFLYFGFESIIDPSGYANLVPDFMTSIISADILVMIHGAVELTCGLLILFGLGRIAPYIILSLSFLGVLVSVSGTTLIRDFAIFGGLLLLTHIYIKKDTTENK